MRTWEQEDIDVLDETSIELDTVLERELVVFNDEVNTFDYVIETLIEVCKHNPEQAEQCTLLIHYKGKCTVKLGNYPTLKPMQEAICERGISAVVL
jgi:ATP-dependent Clp protease adaptor protein ClpS